MVILTAFCLASALYDHNVFYFSNIYVTSKTNCLEIVHIMAVDNDHKSIAG